MATARSTPFGELLLRLRRKCGLTQPRLEERSGVSVRTISDLERGESKVPQRHTLTQLTAALKKEGLSASDAAALQLSASRLRGPALDSARANHLPVASTHLIGREQEVAAVRDLMTHPQARLLTLTGSGGIGKTRLALEVASRSLGAFADGVHFVRLASVRDPALVPSAITRLLEVEEVAGQPLPERLNEFLRHKRLLLVLDNFEHVLPAAPEINDLLGACQRLRVLATSREALRLEVEQEYPVPPLALPEPLAPPAPAPPGGPVAVAAAAAARVRASTAVQLFVERAQAVRPAFTLTDANAADVAEICRRLDGVPLAIKLAARWITTLSLPEMSASMARDERLALLTVGDRDADERHHTMAAALAWSYERLNPAEKALFRRLGVFVGGCTLPAARAVCADGALYQNEIAVRTGIKSLVDKSLLSQESAPGGESWYWMRETIREFALGELAASGEAEPTRRQHATYYLALAEQAEAELRGRNQVAWLDRLERELGNLRATLTWLSRPQGDAAQVMQVAGALSVFWYLRGHWTEGRAWLNGALAQFAAPACRATRARALLGAGGLAGFQGDFDVAGAQLEESVSIWREVGDRQGLAYTLAILGVTKLAQGDDSTARRCLEESEATSRSEQYTWGVMLSANGWGDFYQQRDEYPLSRRYFEESLSLCRELGVQVGITGVLNDLAKTALAQGDYPAARDFGDEGLARAREMRIKRFEAIALRNLGCLDLAKGAAAPAEASLQESLRLYLHIGDKVGMQECLEGLAAAAALRPAPVRAARLGGAAEALREAIRAPLLPIDRPQHERMVEAATKAGSAVFRSAWAEGRAMPLQLSIESALTTEWPAVPLAHPVSPDEPTPRGGRGPLTKREAEVALLVARGLTNRHIAEQFVTSERTVDAHVAHILTKLGFHRRAQIGVWAVQRGLVPLPPTAPS